MGAKLITEIRLEVPGSPATGDEPWSFIAGIPHMENLRRIMTLSRGAGENQDRIDEMADTIQESLGEPEGFDDPISWVDLKAANKMFYLSIMGQAVAEVMKFAAGPALELRRKNS